MNNMTWIKNGGIDMTYNTLYNLLKKDYKGRYTRVDELDVVDPSNRVMTKHFVLYGCDSNKNNSEIILFRKQIKVSHENHTTQMEHQCRLMFLRDILDHCIFAKKGLFDEATYVEPVSFKRSKFQIIKDTWKELWKS
jgi:hypothetical protein